MRIVNILVVRSERVIGRKVKLTRMRPYNSKLTSETSPNKTNPSKSHLAAAAATPSPSALYYPSSTSYGRAHCAPTNKQYHPMAPVQQHPPAPYSSSSPAVSLPPEDPAPGSRTDAAGRLRTGGTSTPGSPRLSTHGRRDSAKVAELHAYRHVSRETWGNWVHASAIEVSGPVRGGRLKSAELSLRCGCLEVGVGMTKHRTRRCAVLCNTQNGLVSLHNLC